MKGKFSIALSLALIAALLVTAVAFADTITTDGDVLNAGPNVSVTSCTATLTFDGSAVINYSGGSHFASNGGTLNLTYVAISPVTASGPATLTLASGWDSNTDSLSFSGITTTVPAGISNGTYKVTVEVSGPKQGGGTLTINDFFNVNVNCPTTPSDSTPPVITPSVVGTLGDNGWYTGDVTVSWSVVDNESTVTSTTGCGSTLINTDTTGTTLTCSATSAGGTSLQSVTIKRDATAPTISGSASPAANVAGWNNTDVDVTFTCGDSLSGVASCGPDATLSVEGADQSVVGTAVDNAGNSANATVSPVNIDKTKPTISAAATTPPNAAGWYNSDVAVEFTCDDTLSGIPAGACPANETLSTEGNAVSSTAQTVTDAAGNTSDLSNVVTVKIDKTAPTLTWNGGPAAGGTYYFGFVPADPTCDAADALSGPSGCTVTGYSDAVGSHTMTATAYDVAGNNYSEQRSYTVEAWTLTGFYQPVDMNGVFNTVKGGSTVPLKFEIFAGATELKLISYVTGISAQAVPCPVNGFVADEIEVLATGSTSLRFDTTGDQFIFNWQTPKKPGACYKVTMTTLDGSSLSAYFKLK